MSLVPYRAYRDSGVAWLGVAPKHWDVKRLKYLCTIQTGDKDTVNAIDDGKYPFFVRSQSAERIGTYTFDCEAVLTAGDGAGVGKVFHYVNGKFDFHQRVYMMNEFRFVSGRFFYWYLSSMFAVVALEGGAKSTVDSLRMPVLMNFPFTVPPLDEQRMIVAFVDTEASKLDALIAEQRRLIVLLNEKRQSITTNAITRGLNPSKSTRESGIVWLGDIPSHWKVERGRFLFRKLDLPPSPEDGVVTAFRDGQVTLRENRRTDGFTLAVLEVGYQKVRTGDLVIHGMDAFAGATGVSESDGKCTPEYSVLAPARRGINNDYFALILRLMAHRNYIYVICPSVRERAPRFRFEAFKDVLLPVPPSDEQDGIVAFVETESEEIDRLSSEAETAISLLQERRSALISAAVTGKIDLRGFEGASTVPERVAAA